ncbi:MAG: hypothetical protein ACTSSG_00685, partial [Candidatus Heimdallarchaeaceae archaeon]
MSSKKRINFCLSIIFIVILLTPKSFVNSQVSLETDSITIFYSSRDKVTSQAASTIYNVLNSFEYPSIKIVPVRDFTVLEQSFVQKPFITIFVFHGDEEGTVVGKEKLSWNKMSLFLTKSRLHNVIFESCYSQKLDEYLLNSRDQMIHTISSLIDAKLAVYDALMATANILVQSQEEYIKQVASNIFNWVVTEIISNYWDYMLRSISPIEPLALDIPETSGFNGPIGFFVDLVFTYLRLNGYSSITDGFTLSQTISLAGEDSLFPTIVDLALDFNWEISYSGGNLELSAGFSLPTDQPEDSKMAKLLKVGNFKVGVSGEFTAVLEPQTVYVDNNPYTVFTLISYSFSFGIELVREIPLIEFLSGGVPSVSSAPSPFSKVLNALSLTLSFGVTLTITKDLVLDINIFDVEVFFGAELSAKIDLAVVSASAGVGVSISFCFSFSPLGNIFGVLFTVYWYVAASMTFWSGELRKEYTWEWTAGSRENPSKNDGKQMNSDTDHDGLSDDLEDILGTSKTLADTDGDGALDGYELFNLQTDPTIVDSDGDGLNDSEEEDYWLSYGVMVSTDT